MSSNRAIISPLPSHAPPPSGPYIATVDVRYSNKDEIHTQGRLLAFTEDGRLLRGFLTDDISVLWRHGSTGGADVGAKRSRSAERD